MKKIIVMILSLMSALIVVTGCMTGCSHGDGVIDIYVPDGAPALALVSIFDSEEIGGEKVRFTVVPADNISAYLYKGEPELAIVPTNDIAIVYNSGKDYRYVSAHTYGNLFIVGKGEGSELSDLKGKTVGVIGQGKVPDLIFQALLKKNGIEYTTDGSSSPDKVNFKYYKDGASVMMGLKSDGAGKLEYGLLAEPAATTARALPGAREIFDIQELWGEGGYPQAGLAAKDSVKDEFINALYEKLNLAGNFAEEHPEEALRLIESHMLASTQTTVKSLTSDIVKGCNIRLVKASECKDDVMALLNAFYDINKSSVGGKLPDENFFRFV